MTVAPHAGAWIEIRRAMCGLLIVRVAPHAGAWIEMLLEEYGLAAKWSLPTRERGLKCFYF